jgi:hypothetical protein
MTAALVAVIIGSLCFSVGEGLRLTPFPNSSLSSTIDFRDLIDAGSVDDVSVAKHGPIDVPAQTQIRGKRQIVELATGSFARTCPFFSAFFHSVPFDAQDPDFSPFIAPHSGRAPPLQS